MEKLLSGAVRLFVVGALFVFGILCFAIPAVGPLLFDSSLPERFRFDNLPLWLQILFGLFVAFYFLLEIWVLCRHRPEKKHHDPSA